MSDFNIEFVEDVDDDGERAGRIVIGDFEEGFLASTEFWSAEDYRAQWLEGARRFVEGADRTCFVTRADGPEIGAFAIEWWTVYRLDAQTVFHNGLFPPEGRAFDYDRLYEFIPDYAPLSEDGDQISEWLVDADAIARFVRHHGH